MFTRSLYIFIIGVLMVACSEQQSGTERLRADDSKSGISQTAAQCLEEAEAAMADDSIRQGETLLRKTIQLSEASGDWHTNYIAYQRLAEALSQGNPEEALRLMKKALAVYEQHPDDERNYVILLDYAGTYAAQVAFITEDSDAWKRHPLDNNAWKRHPLKAYDEATDYIHRAYDIAEKNQMADLMCQTLTSLANIAWAKEDYRQALDYAHRALGSVTSGSAGVSPAKSGNAAVSSTISASEPPDVTSGLLEVGETPALPDFAGETGALPEAGETSVLPEAGETPALPDFAGETPALPGTLQVLARCYLSLDMLDSAETVYRQIDPGDDVHLAYIVQSNLAKIALRRLGATEVEDSVDEAFGQIEDFYYKALEQKDEYYQETLRQEMENQRLEYRSQLYGRTLLTVIIASVVILLAVVLALRYRIRMLRQQRAYEQSKLENELLMQEQEKRRLQEEAEHQKTLLHQANEVVTFLQGFILERTEVMKKLNQSGDSLITLNAHEWSEIERTLNAIDGNRFAKIREQYPTMQEDDIRLCILTRLGLSNRTIGNIYCISVSAVQHRKLKLKKEVFGESSPDVTLEQILNRTA